MAGAPRTIDVGLTTQSASESEALPQGVTFDLEAVYVEIDTSGAGGPVTAELVISEQAGDVIATKRQSATIPAGGTGSATWALRLADDGAGATPLIPTILEEVASDVVTLPPNLGGPATFVPWTPVTVGGVWDPTPATNPQALRTGLLIVSLILDVDDGTPLGPGETFFAELLIPAPIGVFPGVMNLIGEFEATVSNPGPVESMAAAGSLSIGDRAVLALNNNGANPINVRYIIRSNLIVT